jgi:HpcH/HpaI aldolase/citrate lyase family
MGWEPMLLARSRIVQAAATTGISAFDAPFRDIDDADGLCKETEAAKALAFSYKLAIRPAQIAVINSVSRTGAGPDRPGAPYGRCIQTGRRRLPASWGMVDVPVVKYGWGTVARAAARGRLPCKLSDGSNWYEPLWLHPAWTAPLPRALRTEL